jgi:hypothetical protein
MNQFNYTQYLKNNPLLKEGVAEKLKNAKEGEVVELVLDDNKTVKYKRVGTNKSGEPTFKKLEGDKLVGTAGALSISHIKSVK